MKTIEQRINEILGGNHINPNIEYWLWVGDPIRVVIEASSMSLRRYVLPESPMYVEEVLDEINSGDIMECLTSNSQYVRECKKYLINNPNYDYKKIIKEYKKKCRDHQHHEIRQKPDYYIDSAFIWFFITTIAMTGCLIILLYYVFSLFF